MNPSENRVQILEDSIRASVNDTHTFIITLTNQIQESLQTLSEVLSSQDQELTTLNTQITTHTSSAQDLEKLCQTLENQLSTVTEKFKSSSEEFSHKCAEIDKLQQCDLANHLQECEELDRLQKVLKITICLFINITKIRWDDVEDSKLTGRILKDNKSSAFDLSRSGSKLEAINQLWSLLG